MNMSVIIPTYNRKNVLRHTILALKNQNVQELEVIVCDDGSNDGTKEMISGWMGLPFTLVYRYHERDGFRAAATRNMGIEIARGDKIVFIDQDVLVMPHVLEFFNLVKPGHFYCGTKKLVPLQLYEQTFTDSTILDGFVNVHTTFGGIPATLSSFGVITKQDLDKVEKFDEEFIDYGLEDTEMIDRLRDIKIIGLVDSRCFAYHIEHDYEPRKISKRMQDIYHFKRDYKTSSGKIVKIKK